MCLIIASPTGKRISDKILEEAASVNSHGAGLAWSDPKEKKIFFRKGLKVEEVQNLLDNEAEGKAWVAHFRVATIGGVTPDLTHPFTIDAQASVAHEGSADAVFFQNGTFHTWKDYLLQASARSGIQIPPPPWSDSRAIAFCLHVYGKHLLSLLDNQSRFLVFDAKEVVSRRILLWGEWHDYDVFKFSTRSTSAFQTYYPSQQTGNSRSKGSENFQKAADVDDADNEGEASKTTTDAAQTTPNQATSTPSSSEKDTVSSPAPSPSKPFRPRPGYNYWQCFDVKGLMIQADNEVDNNPETPVSQEVPV